jgi:hypothetical protein
LALVIEIYNVLYVEKECEMLAQIMCWFTFLFSPNIKFKYFYIWIFFIKGCSKLHSVKFYEFKLLSLLINVVLKKNQRFLRIKGWKLPIVLQITINLLWIVWFLMFSKSTRWLHIIPSFSLVTNVGHIYCFCTLNLNEEF